MKLEAYIDRRGLQLGAGVLCLHLGCHCVWCVSRSGDAVGRAAVVGMQSAVAVFAGLRRQWGSLAGRWGVVLVCSVGVLFLVLVVLHSAVRQ